MTSQKEDVERIAFEVSIEEFKKVQEKRGGRTWREFFLPAIGVETQRRRCGPPRGQPLSRIPTVVEEVVA